MADVEREQADHCDTCGRWDSGLIDGMCGDCRHRYNVQNAARSTGACCGDCNGCCAHITPKAEEVAA